MVENVVKIRKTNVNFDETSLNLKYKLIKFYKNYPNIKKTVEN